MGVNLQNLSSGCLTQGPQVTSRPDVRTHGFWTMCLEPSPGSNWTLGSTMQASLSRMEGGGLTQEIQGHHMTTDGRHLEADWLAGKGPCVLVH